MIFFYYFFVSSLNQIEKGENKYPDQIYKMPIKPYFFDHFIMTSSFISAQDNIKENNDINNYTRKYVETVKARNKEKEISKKPAAIFVPYQISALNY